MIKNLQLRQNIFFFAILFIGVIYLALLVLANIQILPSFVFQASTLFNDVNSFEEFIKLCTSAGFLWSLILGGGIFYLNFLVFKSIFKFFVSTFVSNLVSGKNYAYVSGFLFPKINISENLESQLNSNQFEAVKLHEEKHKNNYDPLKRLLVNTVKNFLPFKTRIFQEYDVLTELAADEFVIQNQKSNRYLLEAIHLLSLSNNLNRGALNFSSYSNRVDVLIGNQNLDLTRSFVKLLLSILGIFIGILILYFECQSLVQCRFQVDAKEQITKVGIVQSSEIQSRLPQNQSKNCIYSFSSPETRYCLVE